MSLTEMDLPKLREHVKARRGSTKAAAVAYAFLAVVDSHLTNRSPEPGDIVWNSGHVGTLAFDGTVITFDGQVENPSKPSLLVRSDERLPGSWTTFAETVAELRKLAATFDLTPEEALDLRVAFDVIRCLDRSFLTAV